VTFPIYLVRHADAGSRKEWNGPDRLRPLSGKGARQAAALAQRLDGLTIERLATSPFVRCVQTFEPLASQRGLKLAEADDLAEGTPPERAAAFLASLAKRPAAACSHGDVIEALIPRLVLDGMKVEGPAGFAKGSVWELRKDGDRFVSARYWDAP
jgi:8-oxo-(d)GTP phosphatase